MTNPEYIEAYRAVAIQLEKALRADREDESSSDCTQLVRQAEELLSYPNPARDAMNIFDAPRDRYHHWTYGGWGWLVGAVQLRLLVEALIMEQQNTDEYRVRWSRSKKRENDATLGTLVREWREGNEL